MKISKKIDDFQEDIVDTVTKKSGESIRVGSTSFELSDNTLVVRKNGNGFKEKTLIDLENISYTRVRRNANITLLILSIFFIVLGVGATYPLYLYIKNFAFIVLGVGLLIGIILLSIYLSKRNLRITIYLKNGDKIQRISKDMKLFKQVNDFFDELFYVKHQK